MTARRRRRTTDCPRPPSAWGTLYGLGLGPGDPELVTLKAHRILRSVPTILVPVRRAGDRGYTWAIAQPHLAEADGQRVLRLPFPVESDEAAPDGRWAHNCRKILDTLADGQDAAFLTEGDPCLYSTFIHVASWLRTAAPQLPIQIVPGISSITAAAAAAGQPLVVGAGRLAVLPAVYAADELRQTLRDFDTVVLLKVNRVLDRLLPLLDELGLAERAMLVERCGQPDQRIVRGLRQPLRSDYFSLVIVRK